MKPYRKFLGIRAARLTATALCCVLSIAGCESRRSDQYASQADIYLRQGNLDEAQKDFEKAIESNPDNANAHLGLARVFLKRNESAAALASYQKSLSLDTTLGEAYLQAGRLLLEGGDEAVFRELMDGYSEVDAEKSLIVESFLLRNANRFQESIDLIGKRIEEFPDSADLKMSLALSSLSANQPEQAVVQLRDLLERLDPKSITARMLLVEAYRVQGAGEKAANEMETLAGLNPEDASLQMGWAASLLEVGRVDEAEGIARKYAEELPDAGWPEFILGSAQIRKGEYDDAVRLLQKAQKKLPREVLVAQRLKIARSRGSLVTGPPAGAPRHPSPRPVQPEDSLTEWQRLWRSGRLDVLMARAADLHESGDPVPAGTLALAAIFVGDLPSAETYATGTLPDSPIRTYVQALGAMKGKVSRESLEVMTDVLAQWEETDPHGQLLRTLAEAYVLAAVGLRAQAFSKYATAIQRWPEEGVPLLNLAAMYRSAGMPEFTVSALYKLATDHKDNIEALRLLLRTLLDEDMMDKARTYTESAYAIYPDDSGVAKDLARIYLRSAQVDLAIQVLEKTTKLYPGDGELRLMLAGALTRKGETDSALELTKGLPEELFSSDQGLWARSFSHAQKGQWDRVQEVLGARNGPLPYPLYLLSIAAGVKTGGAKRVAPPHFPEALSPFRETTYGIVSFALGLRAQPLDDSESMRLAEALKGDEGALGDFAYASACVSESLFDQALDVLLAIEGRLGSQPKLLEYIFPCLYQPNAMKNRLELAKAMVSKYEDQAAAWLGLAEVYRMKGNEEERRKALIKATQTAPESQEAWFRLAQHGAKVNDPELALRGYQALHNLGVRDPAVLNNLAYFMLRNESDASQAQTYAEEALGKLKGNPSILHTLALAQLRQGSLEESEGNLRQALELRPGDPTLSLDFGYLKQAQGKKDEARRYAKFALLYARQLGLDFPRRDEALQLINAP